MLMYGDVADTLHQVVLVVLSWPTRLHRHQANRLLLVVLFRSIHL
jgi:hypothetical protein